MKQGSEPRIVFFGTPELSVYVLEELLSAGVTPTCIVTAPDRPAGRRLLLTPSPVKVWAEKHSVPVVQPETLRKKEGLQFLTEETWDLFVVVAYGLFLPEWVLRIPEHGALNIHPSLLPKNRGPSPIRSALRDDEKGVVGVSIIVLDKEMDHGPIVAQASIELPEWPVKGCAVDEILFTEGGRLLLDVLPAWMNGEIKAEEQDHAKATYTKKFVKTDGEIRLTDDGYENYRKYCAHEGWPGTFFFTEVEGKSTRVKVTDAVFENGMFIIQKVVPEGKQEMSFSAWQASR